MTESVNKNPQESASQENPVNSIRQDALRNLYEKLEGDGVITSRDIILTNVPEDDYEQYVHDRLESKIDNILPHGDPYFVGFKRIPGVDTMGNPVPGQVLVLGELSVKAMPSLEPTQSQEK